MAVVVEAISEIVTSSTLFFPVRNFLKKKSIAISEHYEDLLNNIRTPVNIFNLTKDVCLLLYYCLITFLDKLISCGYCTSVWVSGLVSIYIRIDIIDNVFISWIISTFLFHRVSNLLHVLYERVRRGMVNTYDIELKLNINDGDNYGRTGESETETIHSEYE